MARDTLRETIAKAKRDANDSSERIAAALRPGNDAAAVAINAEIRSVLRTMTDGDRVSAIKGALDGGDLRLARAVLFESPLLCPLPPEVRSHLQDKFFEVGAQNDPAYPKLLALRAGTQALEVTQTQLDAHLATLAADAKSVGIAVTPEQAEALGLPADPRMQRGEA